MIFQKKKTIVTHPGRFHADDLFAVAMLLEYVGDAKVLRTEAKDTLAHADYVVDVGRVYDPVANRFDHHQGTAGERANGIPYAASGLVWKHFGEKIAGSKEIRDKVDDVLIAQIDVTDTGAASLTPLVGDIYPYVLDNVAGAFAATWQEGNKDTTESFMFLLPFARALLKREITKARASVMGRDLMKAAYEQALDKRYIIMDIMHPPMDFLDDKKDVLYVVSPDARGGWSVYAVRKNKKEYGNRKDFPLSWAGKSGEELAKISGVPDAGFCHLKLFLAVAKSKQGAIALAKKAVEA